MTQGAAGQPVTLTLDFWLGGALTDPSSVTLDVTYGEEVGFVPDVAGPFTYSGASSSIPGQVYRTGTGQYAFVWQIPASAVTGVYVANWTVTQGGNTYLGVENFPVTGTSLVPVPGGDVGFWTGGLIYAAAGLDIEFGRVDSNGITWLWQKIQGWDGPPVQGAGVIPRSGDHGAWASPQYYAARTLTLTVTASAPTQALRDVARAMLQQAVPVSDLAILRYDEPIAKQVLVRRSGQVTEAYPTLADVTFTVGLVAPDPRRYAAIQKSLTITPIPPGPGGGLVVPFSVPFTLDAASPPAEANCVNAGNFGSPPVVVITGPCSAPMLTNLTTGQSVSWSGLTLSGAQTLTVDFLNRQAWANAPVVPSMPGQSPGGGTYVTADISSAWWTLQPGQNLVQFTGTTSSGASAAVYFRDSWSLFPLI